MNVLLVEDDMFKQELVEKILCEHIPNLELAIGRSVQQGVQLVKLMPYDLIVLDMALPSHDSRPGGAQPISLLSGGVEILLELSYEERRDKVIIVTQYPEIEFDGHFYPLAKVQKSLAKLISINLIGVIHFDILNKSWCEQLRKAIA